MPVIVHLSGFSQQVFAAQQRRTDDAEIMALVTRWDNAKTREEKEHWLEVIYRALGNDIESVVRSRSRGRLSSDQIESLAWRALNQSINVFGRAKFQQNSILGNDWTDALKSLAHQARTIPFATMIWNAIPTEVKGQIEDGVGHLHRKYQLQAIHAINDALVRPELANLAAKTVQTQPEAQALLANPISQMNRSESSFLCALALQKLLPELRKPEPPPNSLFGHVVGFTLKGLVPAAIAEEQGLQLDTGVTTALSRLRPDIEEERRLRELGKLPEGWEQLSRPERIRRLQLKRIRREYGDRLSWWESTAKQLGRNLTITGGDSWGEAKKLFLANQIPPQLWAFPYSRYYVPRRAAHPYGIQAIQRALDLLERRRTQQPTAPVAAPPREGGAVTQRDPDLYRAIVNHLYSSPGHEAERAVGELLSLDPRPDQNAIEEWLGQLPEAIASDVRDFGFLNLAREIDQRVKDFLSEPGALKQLERITAVQNRPGMRR